MSLHNNLFLLIKCILSKMKCVAEVLTPHRIFKINLLFLIYYVHSYSDHIMRIIKPTCFFKNFLCASLPLSLTVLRSAYNPGGDGMVRLATI